VKADREREREGERERERERNLKGFQRTRVLLCTIFAYIKGDQYNKMQGYPKIFVIHYVCILKGCLRVCSEIDHRHELYVHMSSGNICKGVQYNTIEG